MFRCFCTTDGCKRPIVGQRFLMSNPGVVVCYFVFVISFICVDLNSCMLKTMCCSFQTPQGYYIISAGSSADVVFACGTPAAGRLDAIRRCELAQGCAFGKRSCSMVPWGRALESIRPAHPAVLAHSLCL